MNKKVLLFSGISIGVIGLTAFLIYRHKKNSTNGEKSIGTNEDVESATDSKTTNKSNENSTRKNSFNNVLNSNRIETARKCSLHKSVWDKYRGKYVRIGNIVYYCYGDALLLHFSRYPASKELTNEQLWNMAVVINPNDAKYFYETSIRPVQWEKINGQYVFGAITPLVQRNPSGLAPEIIKELFECSRSLGRN